MFICYLYLRKQWTIYKSVENDSGGKLDLKIMIKFVHAPMINVWLLFLKVVFIRTTLPPFLPPHRSWMRNTCHRHSLQDKACPRERSSGTPSVSRRGTAIPLHGLSCYPRHHHDHSVPGAVPVPTTAAAGAAVPLPSAAVPTTASLLLNLEKNQIERERGREKRRQLIENETQ